MAEVKSQGSRKNYWAQETNQYGKHTTELRTLEVLCLSSESDVLYIFKSENFKNDGWWNSLNKKGFKNTVWIMSRFMQKKMDISTTLPTISMLPFSFLFLALVLQITPMLNWASTSHSVRVSSTDPFIIMKNIINIFYLKKKFKHFFLLLLFLRWNVTENI